MSNHLKNIAIIGGTGRIGSPTLSALLATNRFAVTALTRADSTSTFPASVVVKKGDYADRAFLESAFKGQDALVISLSIQTPHETQDELVEAAVAAGVKWILPNEFGSDNFHPVMGPGQGPVVSGKVKVCEKIRELGANYIAYVNGCWYDYSLAAKAWGIDIPARRARLFTPATISCSTTSLRTAGLGLARLLSLPITTTDGSPSLSSFANGSCFVEGMRVTQRDMLGAVQRATGTGDKDWEINETPVDEVIEGGRQQMAQGDFRGFRDLLYGLQFKEGAGGDFHANRSNEVLGLQEDKLDVVTGEVVKAVEEGKTGELYGV